MTIGMRLMMFSFVCGGSANSKFSMSDAAMACISMRAKRQPVKKHTFNIHLTTLVAHPSISPMQPRTPAAIHTHQPKIMFLE